MAINLIYLRCNNFLLLPHSKLDDIVSEPPISHNVVLLITFKRLQVITIMTFPLSLLQKYSVKEDLS